MFEDLHHFLDFYLPNKVDFSDFLRSEELLGNKVSFFNKDSQINELQNFDLLILGLPEMRNSGFDEEQNPPNKIREELYKLYCPRQEVKILDLGNLKIGTDIKDSYSLITEFLSELLDKDLTITLLGGSKDLLYPITEAYNKTREEFSFATAEPRLSLAETDAELPEESTYLSTVLKEKSLFHYTNIGLQTYLNPPSLTRDLNAKHETIRLGVARSQLSNCEPAIRDSDLFGVDISTIKQSDAPGAPGSSIHGFYGEEVCQLAKYAGTGDKISAFGLFNFLPSKDKNNQTAMLSAQIVWHFIQAFYLRQGEISTKTIKQYPKHLVQIEHLSEEIVFYHSPKTDRRWFEIEYSIGNQELTKLISCSSHDFEIAKKGQIPSRWWKFYEKLNSSQIQKRD